MPIRQFNVFSAEVVTYPGETFQWVLGNDAASSQGVTVQPTGSWPLDQSSYNVSPASNTASATVSAGAEPGESDFTCNPPAPTVTTQKLIVAAQNIVELCTDVVVDQGDHFIWQNLTSQTVTITADPGNTNDWPLDQDQYVVAPNQWVSVKVPEDALEDSYTLLITNADGSSPCQMMGTQPKIVVTSDTPK
jgi:hypothetical protein